jgi:hypothetical protein
MKLYLSDKVNSFSLSGMSLFDSCVTEHNFYTVILDIATKL